LNSSKLAEELRILKSFHVDLAGYRVKTGKYELPFSEDPINGLLKFVSELCDTKTTRTINQVICNSIDGKLAEIGLQVITGGIESPPVSPYDLIIGDMKLEIKTSVNVGNPYYNFSSKRFADTFNRTEDDTILLLMERIGPRPIEFTNDEIEAARSECRKGDIDGFILKLLARANSNIYIPLVLTKTSRFKEQLCKISSSYSVTDLRYKIYNSKIRKDYPPEYDIPMYIKAVDLEQDESLHSLSVLYQTIENHRKMYGIFN